MTIEQRLKRLEEKVSKKKNLKEDEDSPYQLEFQVIKKSLIRRFNNIYLELKQVDKILENDYDPLDLPDTKIEASMDPIHNLNDSVRKALRSLRD